MKKRIALLLVVCLVMSTPLMALAARPNTPGLPADIVTPLYLNLGDSIAYGMSAEPGKSYFDRYARTLQPGLAVNMGAQGLTSGELLAGLGLPDVQLAVAGADVINISIGGNNLLRPVILAAFGAYGLNYGDYGDMEAALTALYTAIYVDEMLIPGTWETTINSILTSPELSGFLTARATDFTDDWGSIIASIRSLNENATIKVLNLYNPVKAEHTPLLHANFEELLAPMNQTLNQLQTVYGYQVADVYTAFKNDKKSVEFTLALDSLNLDPHPTTKGHQIIFRELMKLGNVRAFQPGKPDFAGNQARLAITETEEIAIDDVGGLPAAHEVTGAELGELVAQTAQEDPGALVDHIR
ncbi:MAG: GDSL-type esterase/lipase family protein [Bacillota bacterium]|nr:GDSL-type esterase/lipase family protein [Bacillota bacterium]MDW7677656.1 GDSL-type esterase/lipase family protein [Bacillota bacterium]